MESIQNKDYDSFHTDCARRSQKIQMNSHKNNNNPLEYNSILFNIISRFKLCDEKVTDPQII